MGTDVPTDPARTQPPRFRVLIAGGGVAALEALLALRELAGDRVAVQLFAPDPRFRHRPLSVTEPFALSTPRQLDLLEIALEHHAMFLEDGLAGVDPDRRLVRTAGGRELEYDALLIATGTRAADAVPGAIHFNDSMDGAPTGACSPRSSAAWSEGSPSPCPITPRGRWGCMSWPC